MQRRKLLCEFSATHVNLKTRLADNVRSGTIGAALAILVGLWSDSNYRIEPSLCLTPLRAAVWLSSGQTLYGLKPVSCKGYGSVGTGAEGK